MRRRCASIQATLDAQAPRARSLLDVGCGTGRHLELLRERYEVEGLDINPTMLEAARERCPDVTFHEADMADFDLGSRFDVVMCLFSSIGYVRTEARLRSAVLCMRRHLNPGGFCLSSRGSPPSSTGPARSRPTTSISPT